MGTMKTIGAGSLVAAAPTPANVPEREVRRQVGERVRLAREAAGITVDVMSEAFGVSRPHWYRYEAGVSPLKAERLFRVAVLTGVPVSFFFEPWESARAKGIEEGGGVAGEVLLAFQRLDALNRRDPTRARRVMDLLADLVEE